MRNIEKTYTATAKSPVKGPSALSNTTKLKRITDELSPSLARPWLDAVVYTPPPPRPPHRPHPFLALPWLPVALRYPRVRKLPQLPPCHRPRDPRTSSGFTISHTILSHPWNEGLAPPWSRSPAQRSEFCLPSSHALRQAERGPTIIHRHSPRANSFLHREVL